LRQLEAWGEEFPLRYGRGELLKPQTVLETLQRLTAGRDDVVFTTGVGQHQMWAMQYLRCDVPRSFITSGGLGTMGYGVPAAIGAKAARPNATVVCVDGDGCFQMTQQELATSVLEELPIVVVIVNNGYLGMVRQWQDMFFEERFSQIRLTHTVSVLVENKPGVLMRIASLFARRGFNIESLAVGPTERHDVSRITIRVDCETSPLEQIEKQMHKLVNVLRVAELVPGESIERELVLMKVSAPPAKRAELMALGEVFGARVVDLGTDSIVFELTGPPEDVDSFEELVRPHGLQELVRTGSIGLGRAHRPNRNRPRQHVLA